MLEQPAEVPGVELTRSKPFFEHSSRRIDPKDPVPVCAGNQDIVAVPEDGLRVGGPVASHLDPGPTGVVDLQPSSGRGAPVFDELHQPGTVEVEDTAVRAVDQVQAVPIPGEQSAGVPASAGYEQDLVRKRSREWLL